MEYFYTFLKGFAMGAANVIPGVSGGTVAFITGIYERLINALKSFDLKAIRLLFTLKFKDFTQHVDLAFLASLGLGVLLSILTLAKTLKWAYKFHPTLVSAFFFGLIFASIFSVGKMVTRWQRKEVIFAFVGCLFAVVLSFLSPATENMNPFYLLTCGVAGICSMIIPGISGSFILLLMGNYQLIVLKSVNNLRQLNFAESLPVLIPVGIGAILGLILLSHLLSLLFKKYHNLAVALITGFVAGSLVIIWPWKSPEKIDHISGKVTEWQREFPNFLVLDTWIAIGLMLVGVALILVMEITGKKKLPESK